ncbi:MAG: EamA family transporter [Atopobiaceae bacterium]|nr:EamA family transporter [Atopobiaceae bacterium]
MSHFARGILSALVGAALWGFSGSCSQYLFSHYDISPVLLTTIRMLGAGALFMLVLHKNKREVLHDVLSTPSTVKRLLFYGSFGLFLNSFTYVLVISYTNAGTATVLQSLNVIFCLLASCVMERRGPRGLEIAGIICALVATVLIATKGDLTALNLPLPGLIWGIINAICCALYIMYPKRLFEQYGSLPITGTGMLIGGICALAAWLGGGLVFGVTSGQLGASVHVPAFGWDAIGLLVAIVCLGTFAAYGLYLHGVSIVGGVRGSLLGTLEPVSAMVFSALWLSTVFVWADWLALVLMVITIVLVTLQGGDSSDS